MLKLFSADYLFTSCTPPVKNGFVLISSDGKILEVGLQSEIEQVKRKFRGDLQEERHEGIICPGFVNAHCHLELSHLKGKIPEKTGLPEFLKRVQKIRNTNQRGIISAIKTAEEEMHKNGIVAVGDISNSLISAEIKKESDLYYHTFIELIGFNPVDAEKIFLRGIKTFEEFQKTLTGKHFRTSLSPHAPYSVSFPLMEKIAEHCRNHSGCLAIHNQECEDENIFFRNGSGKIALLLDGFSLNLASFQPEEKNSLPAYFNYLNTEKIQLVHNTFTSEEDIRFLKKQSNRKIYLCLCPHANLYIEGRLPDINMLSKYQASGIQITIGTDSLASNHGLSILEEMKIIAAHFPEIPLDELIRWATRNGAEFLGFKKQLGSLEKGKTPGLNLITGVDLKNLTLTPESEVRSLKTSASI